MKIIKYRFKKESKGVALVIAMLMAALLSAAGLLAINNARFEIQSTAFIRQSEQAARIAESGLTIGSYTFSRSYDAYERFMRKYNLKKIDIRLSDFEASGIGIFEQPQNNRPGSFGWVAPTPTFTVTADRPVESLPVKGFSLPGANTPHFCFKKYRFGAYGRLIYSQDPNSYGMSERGYRAFIIIGPIQCTQ